MTVDQDSNTGVSYFPRNIKKSDFIAKEATGLVDSDTFDFVQNGTNFKISLAELVKKFGAIGTLVQIGDATGVPVLVVDGTNNQIRNIIGKSGIVASVSASDGIQLDHNFTVDATGVPIMSDATATSPTLRSIRAGTGVSVAAINGAVQIALSATPVSNKTVIVNEMADFPTAATGVITLEADTLYFITNDLTTSDRFVLSADTVVAGSDGTLIELAYTGSGVMFTSLNNSNKLKDIILTASSGTLFSVTGTGAEVFQINNCRVACDTIGVVDAMFVASFSSILWNVTTDGITFLNNNSVIAFDANVVAIAAGTFVDLGVSTTGGFSFVNSLGTIPSGATFISGAPDSANITAGGLATVLNTRAQGAGTPLAGITPSDALWEFAFNNGIVNSINSLLAHHTGGTVVIAASGTPVKIGATWTFSHESRFTGNADGTFTYVGKGSHVNLVASVTADIPSGVDDLTFYFYKNGIQEANSGVLREFDSGDPGNISMVWQMDLETDDTVSVWVENNDTSVNVIIEHILVSIS